MIRPLPKFKDMYTEVKVKDVSTVIGTHKIVTPTKLGILSEFNLLKKIQKIGNRNNLPSSIELFIYDGSEMGFFRRFSPIRSGGHSTTFTAQEAFVEFMFDYSLKGNIVGLNVVKGYDINGTSLKLIVAPTNDYSYSNINAEVIDSLIQSVDWN